ncbi:MAG: histidine kinase [Rhodanobacter sp.]
MVTANISTPSAIDRQAIVPFWLPILAGLPITLCMVVMGLPELGFKHTAGYRSLFIVAYIVWSFPLTAIQRSLWRRRVSWWPMVLVMLVATYVPSLVNKAIFELLAVHWGQMPTFMWAGVFTGLDGCWLAMIAFCAIHAVVAYYFELKASQQRVLDIATLARDAELRALRYQLHPHFLFNTLNAISSLVIEGHSRDATRMIARLGDFLRATLEQGEAHEVPLADELSLTEHYLDIEKARLGARLQIDLRIGPDVLRALVPYLLLQPLVENAIRHGIAPRREGGRIELHIARVGDRLELSLRNDGVAEDVEKAPLPSRASAIGLRNVRERLDKLYGEQHLFDLMLADDGSCTVRIALPYRLATSLTEPRAATA